MHRNNFTDVLLARPQRQSKPDHSRSRSETTTRPRNVHITDAVFADFEATNLRFDEPPTFALHGADPSSSDRHCDGLVQQLASQLQALDQQRNRLTRLLNDLQSSHSAAV